MWILAAILFLGFWAYHRFAFKWGVLGVSFITLGAILTQAWPIWVGVLVLALTASLAISVIRKGMWTAPLLKVFQKMLPPLSETERIALESGTVGFEGDLFSGKPQWDNWLALPSAKLTPAEQAFLDGPVERLTTLVNDWKITHEDADLSPEVWAYLKQERFFGLIIPERFGGHGFSALAHHKVIEKLSAVSSTLSSTVAVPNSLGPGELLMHYGTPEQQDYYLPRLAMGEDIPCFGLTSPVAGSDATSIVDQGIVGSGYWNGKEELGVYLTFNKRYITLAPVASLIGLAFRLYDPQGLLGGQKDRGISLALLPRETEGVKIGRRHFPLNIPFQNGPIEGENVFIPLTQLIGGREYIGKGWQMLVECLSIGRAITLPSTASGSSKMATVATTSYARLRKQFGLSVGRFEGVEEALSRMIGHTYTLSALSEASACAVDRGEKPAVISTIAKYHGTELGRKVIQDAMDVQGGKGIILGPKNYLGRAWQAAPIGITVEGANIMTRSLMIFGQGAILSHPWVLKEMKAVQETDAKVRLETFDRALMGHVGFAFSNAIRSLWFGLTASRFGKAPGNDYTKRFYRKLNRYSAALALMTDVSLMSLGGRLKFKENLSGRLGDVLSHLYMASSILKRDQDRGLPEDERVLLAWAFHNSIHQIEMALSGAIRNFPSRPLSVLLWMLVFPWGRRAHAPSDRLSHKVVALLFNPSLSRNRMLENLPLSSDHPAARVIASLQEAVNLEPLERKWNKIIKEKGVEASRKEDQWEEGMREQWITPEECQQLRRLHEMTLDAITVDDFDPKQLKSNAATQ